MLHFIQTPKTERKELPLRLQLLGFNHKQEPVIRPNGLNIYQWFYCSKGKGEIIINGEYNVVTEGSGFFLLPHTSHSYQALTPDWTVHIIGFEGPACGKILSALGMYKSGVYQFRDNNIFLQYVQSLFFIKDRKMKNKKLSYSKECYSFLLDIADQITPMQTEFFADNNSIVTSIITYLEDHFDQCLSLDELATSMNRSKEYLCTTFKKYTGKTIIQLLTETRIIHARNLLLQYPEKNVNTISEECGFSSTSYFGKKFKQLTGTSPEKYRKSHL